ncbi:MAG TPA: ribonuclease III [Acidobacteriota bacterium]|nr:ribonuclease III [Acidobacteriota bacterium]
MSDEFSDLQALQQALQYPFKDPSFLERALTHKSYCYEHPDAGLFHYESLEFLGDAILGFVISDLIFRQIPLSTEGELSKIKAHLVSAKNLLQFALRLELGRFLRLSYGEEKTGGRTKEALMVDSFEAVIAAIYLDGGIDAARQFIEQQFSSSLQSLDSSSFTSPDYKSRLQERLHQLAQTEPIYLLAHESGPDHRKHFVVKVISGGEVLALGEGKTKKEAQQNAAEAALEKLKDRG